MNQYAIRGLKAIKRSLQRSRETLRFMLDESMLYFEEAEREYLERVYALLNEAAGTLPVNSENKEK